MTILKVFLPEFFLTATSLIMLIVNILYFKNQKQRFFSWLSLILISLFLFIAVPFDLNLSSINGSFLIGSGYMILRIFLFFSLFLIYLSSYRLLISSSYLIEFSFFLCISVPFLSFLLTSANFLIAFVLIECISFGFYILVSFYKNNLYSVEAGLKYFYLGTFSSLILFLGLFLVYYSTLEFSFSSIVVATSRHFNSLTLTLGLILIFLALIFKLGGAPLQFWLPEVYQGSPFVVFPLLIAISKLSIGLFLGNAFYFLISKMFIYVDLDNIKSLFYITSLLSMLIGNFFALKQNEVKRLLAYSSIAHVGYLLSLLSLNPVESNFRLLAGYLFIYSLTNLSFLIALQLQTSKEIVKIPLQNYEQILPKCPLLLFSMLIFALSLAGLPPTAGFMTKLFVLLELVRGGSYLLSLIFLLTSILSIYYYFRLINPILKTFRNRQEMSEINSAGGLHEAIVKILLLITGLYLVISVFKPNYIFFM